MKRTSYDNTSISSLKGEDRVRKRPGVIFGSDGIDGARHTFVEILSNSIDEAREGFGTHINVVRHADKSISIEDFGRGIPLEYNRKEKRHNWELVYLELYAGGKYDNNIGENYEYSLGLNGLGACATQYASEFFDVRVRRDGYEFTLHFEKGVNKGGLKRRKLSDDEIKTYKTGTFQRWKPDLEVFTDIDIDIEYLCEILKKQAVVNSGLEFHLYDEENDENYSFKYANGIVDYLKEVSDGKEFSTIQYAKGNSSGRDRKDKPEYKVKAEIAYCFNNEVNICEYYHNSSFLEYGGAPDRAVKSAFVAELDSFAKKQNKYQRNEKKISFQDIQDSLIIVISSFSTLTSYENQTKKAITNKFVQDYLNEFLRHELEIYFIENMDEANKILEQVLVNKRSRENAEKTRLSLRKKLSQKIDVVNRVKKFVDCRTKEISEREIYIVEGDSALGACKLARDAEFQALMPVRGKILNCLKSDYDKIFASDIIIDLIKVLGCGVEIKSKHSKKFSSFDIDELNWDKVIICTDADVDGFQIRTLILAMIYRLMPTLIDEGKVYIAQSPLYEITSGKDTFFAYDEEEKKQVLDMLDNKKYKLQRSKGLGENEPEMMWQTTMSPSSRRLIAIKPDLTEEETASMFDTLLGDDINSRKEFIESHGEMYIEKLDIN